MTELEKRLIKENALMTYDQWEANGVSVLNGAEAYFIEGKAYFGFWQTTHPLKSGTPTHFVKEFKVNKSGRKVIGETGSPFAMANKFSRIANKYESIHRNSSNGNDWSDAYGDCDCPF